MFILIAPEKDIRDEIDLLHQLFEVGLACYHLRKPEKNHRRYRAYLDQIDAEYHRRIVVHHCHELINEYALKGIHFTEQKRCDHFGTLKKYRALKTMTDKTMSSSFHKIDDLRNCSFNFDYSLLGPVFSSISKKGYLGQRFDVTDIDKTIVGVGGATAENMCDFMSLGYSGIGVLGALWTSATPVADFKTMRCHFEALKTTCN